jgi:integrase
VAVKWEARQDEEGRRYAVLRWTEDGTRKSRPIGYQTPEVAEELRRDHEAALRLGVASPIDSFVRVADVLAGYLRELEHRPVSDGYAELELQRCNTLARLIGRLPVESVSGAVLSRYLGDRRRERTRHGTTPRRSTVLMEVDTLRRAYRTMIELRRIAGPVPARPAGKLPNDQRPPRRLTEAEVARLVTQAHADDDESGHWRWSGHGLGWLFQVLAWSGRRPVAVLDVRVEDLDRLLDERTAREDQLVYWRRDKGGESLGWGPVTEPARTALAARAREVGSGRLWPGVGDAGDLHRPLRRVSKRARVWDVQVYDLRRHAVTQILRGVGGLTKVARRYTGHLRDETLLRYAYAADGEAEALAPTIGWAPAQLRVAGEDETNGR